MSYIQPNILNDTLSHLKCMLGGTAIACNSMCHVILAVVVPPLLPAAVADGADGRTFRCGVVIVARAGGRGGGASTPAPSGLGQVQCREEK